MSSWFNTLKQTGNKALCAFITAGYPSRKGCLEYVDAFARGGADVIEVGVPFSDPLADGPVIQATSQKALRRGATLESALELVSRMRGARCVLMSYLNPLLSYGLDRFFRDAREAGVAGVIPTDLIPEEADDFLRGAGSMPVTFLVSPTCRPDRLRLIARRTTGFLYLVSLKGVTGARRALPADLPIFVRRVRSACRQPLYVGFGISTPEHARAVGRLADGIVVGSALLRRIEDGASPRAVERFVASLRRGLDG
jgi:tryptophan synthase alpha chain